MPSPIESSAETPQIRYPWESKPEEPQQLQMAEEYEDLEEQKKVENRSFDSNTEIKFNKEVPSVEKEQPPVEVEEEPVAIKIEAAPQPTEEKKETLLLEENEETKMIDAGEDQTEEIVPIAINTNSPEAQLEEAEKEEPTPQVLDMTSREAEIKTDVQPTVSPESEEEPVKIEISHANNEPAAAEVKEEAPAKETTVGSMEEEMEDEEEEEEEEEESAEPVQKIKEEEEWPKIDAKTKERLEFLGQEMIDRWEEYKKEPNREKVVNIDFEEITEKTAEEKDALLQAFQDTFRSFLFRLTIEEGKEKLGLQRTGGGEQFSPVSNPNSREFIADQLRNLVFDSGSRNTLKQFVLDIIENLRFKNFEEKYDLENAKNYSIESDRMKNISRDELGQLLLEMAKEYISESVPSEDELSKVYEEKFGKYLKSCDLFDLEIILKENAIISQMATEKNIQNIALLTSAFEKFLSAKKTEKEEKVKEYLEKRLQQEKTTEEPAEEKVTETTEEDKSEPAVLETSSN